MSSSWHKTFGRRPLAAIGLIMVASMVTIALFAPWLATHDPQTHDRSNLLAPPSSANYFGTDPFGRDVYSRMIWGSRVTLEVGVSAVLIAGFLGVVLGLGAGYGRGWLGIVLTRIGDVLLAFPILLIAMIACAIIGPGLPSVTVAIGVGLCPRFMRVVRSEVLALRERDFVTAARVLGAGPARIMVRHILPNLLGSILVLASLYLPHAIITESSLGYLGVVGGPQMPSWGSMTALGRGYLTAAPWVAVFPGTAIMVTVVAFNLLGDGLRDLLDPRLRDQRGGF